MRKVEIVLAVFGSLIFSSIMSYAATYYVSATLGNDANAGTAVDKPKKTIQSAIDAAAAGDTVKILTGTYGGGITMNKENLLLTVPANNHVIINTRGSKDAIITITAHGSKIKVPDPTATLYIDDPYPIQGAVDNYYYTAIISYAVNDVELTGAYIQGPSSASRNFQIRGASNYKDLKTSRGGGYIYQAIVPKGDNWLIQDLEIFNITHCAINASTPSTNIKIWDNYIHDTFVDQIRFPGLTGAENTYNHKTLIERNVLVGSYISDGFQTNATIKGEYNNTSFVLRHNVIGDSAEQNLDLKGAQYVLIESNWLYRGRGDNDGPLDGVIEPSNGTIICGSNQVGKDIIIRKNIVVDMAGGITTGWNLSRVAEYHNVSVNSAYDQRGSNQTTPYKTPSLVFHALALPGPSSANKNNIGINGALFSMYAYWPAEYKYISDYNLYYNPDYRNGEIKFLQKPDLTTYTLPEWRAAHGLDIHSIVGDPLLNLPNYLPTGSPYGKDFSLKAGSPAINAGDWLCTVTAVSGNTLSLSDRGTIYFYDGFGIASELPDMVYDDDGNSSRLVSIDRTNNKITLQNASGFTIGDGLTTIKYNGIRPDIGAFEYSETSMTPPSAPGGLTVK